MDKLFGVRFGSGLPNQYAGLTPTFYLFINDIGATLASPTLAEVGPSTGFYKFNYDVGTTQSIFFVVDGGVIITNNSDRYVSGTLNPIQQVDQVLGFVGDSYGGTLSPTAAMGLIKRLVEENQADATFDKSTGIWDVYARGTSILLFAKTLANNPGDVTKT